MSEHDDTAPLRRMLESARGAVDLVRGAAGSERSGEMLDQALAYTAQAVGFAAAHVSLACRQRHPEVPWEALRREAELLLADYDRVDGGALRDRISAEFPRLVRALARILDEEARRPAPAPAPRVPGDEVERRVGVPRQTLEEFCRRHHIYRLSVFGSVLREDFHGASDLDVLVEFEPGKTPGLEFFAIEEELSRQLGRPVDLFTRQSIAPDLRDRVVSQAHDVYVAGA